MRCIPTRKELVHIEFEKVPINAACYGNFWMYEVWKYCPKHVVNPVVSASTRKAVSNRAWKNVGFCGLVEMNFQRIAQLRNLAGTYDAVTCRNFSYHVPELLYLVMPVDGFNEFRSR